MFKLSTIIFLLVAFSHYSLAEALSFEEVWRTIEAVSPAQKAAHLQAKASASARARAKRHWLPNVYLDVKAYKTNDPATSFFGLIQQRAVVATDFSPAFINKPPSDVYSRGAVGMNMALYEGGMKSAQVEMLDSIADAQENKSKQVKIDQYAQTGLLYASISIIDSKKEKLITLQKEVNKLLKRYQLGSRANPVGYSGLLGMKSLANRVSGLLIQYQSQTQAYYAMLSEMGLSNKSWSAATIIPVDFVNKYLTSNSANNRSFKLESLSLNAKSGQYAAKMERAKYLPQVGAFAEGYMFDGDRDTSDGYTAGVYLRWNLFNSSDYGSYSEAKLKAEAASKNSEAMAQQERAERKSLHQSLIAIKENINLLHESDRLLGEQVRTAHKLFNNGSINALQMVEVLNRRVDIISQLSIVELELVGSAAKLLTTKQADIKNNFIK